MISTPESAWDSVENENLSEEASILIVEDEFGPREALKQILQNQYHVFTCEDASQALDIVKDTPVDLITIDLRLPGIPGQQLIGDLKRLSPHSELVVISGSGTLESAIECIRCGVADFITKPFGVVEVLATINRLIDKNHKKRKLINLLQHIQENQSLTDSSFRLPSSFPEKSSDKSIDILEFARVLAFTLDGQDRYTHGHCERVANYSLLLAEEFGFTPVECKELMIAAYLHDIGKVGIDRQIIRKDGPLSSSELIILRSHPQRGVRIVAPLGLSSLSLAVIRHHHECWDGTGYPDGLTGEQIHLAARIVRVVDAYDAMTSDRPYRTALPKKRAIEELQEGTRKKFDPDVVSAFLQKIN